MRATLKFLADLPVYDEEQPYMLYGFSEAVGPLSNCVYEYVSNAEVDDMRDATEGFVLQDCGFQFLRQPSACRLQAELFEDHENREEVAAYLLETTRLATQAVGAARALCIDWRFRRAGSTSSVKDQLHEIDKARYRALAPAALMHCDYSYTGGLMALKKHLTADEFEDVLGGRGRYRIVNVWRPLSRVENSPLVVCDRRTVNPKDALEMDQVSPGQVEKSIVLKYRPSQQWFWLSNQLQEEVILFTSWDSVQEENIYGYTPHGALVEDNVGWPDHKPRESIEVRLVVMWPLA